MTTIHALSVGGGIVALSAVPGGDGAYKEDLDHIRGWAPALVLSLTSEVELLEAKALGLGNDLRGQGARWFHLPIVDYGIPDDTFEAGWPEVSGFARKALAGGGRVLVHCKGGCGRSGMIVLRLMIEAGEPPVDALERLRTVRPCAIETDEQMQWAMSGQAAAPAQFVRGTS